MSKSTTKHFHKYPGDDRHQMNCRFLTVVLLILCASCGIWASPPSAEDFTRSFLSKLQAEIDDHKFVYCGPLDIADESGASKSVGHLYLDRIYGYVSENPDQADAAISSYIGRISQVIKEADRPLDQADVLLVVRDATSVRRSTEMMASGPRAAFPRVLTKGLVIVAAINTPGSIKYVGENDLSKLGLDEAQLFALGEKNLRSLQKPFSEVAKVPPNSGLGVITEEFAASRLLFLHDWAAMAKAIGGNLVVMAPAFDTVIYGDGTSVVGVDALRTIGKRIAARSQVPLSSTILRYSGDHWEEID
ncbi:MAG: DUF1444 family protein [Opitutaceae bacterium]